MTVYSVASPTRVGVEETGAGTGLPDSITNTPGRIAPAASISVAARFSPGSVVPITRATTGDYLVAFALPCPALRVQTPVRDAQQPSPAARLQTTGGATALPVCITNTPSRIAPAATISLAARLSPATVAPIARATTGGI